MSSGRELELIPCTLFSSSKNQAQENELGVSLSSSAGGTAGTDHGRQTKSLTSSSWAVLQDGNASEEDTRGWLLEPHMAFV